jgi:hypothetical protein
MEEVETYSSIDRLPEAEVNKVIKSITSVEERRFLLALCKNYHVANLDKVIHLTDWVRLGLVCVSHLKDISFSLNERLLLITNELFAYNFSPNHIKLFFTVFVENLEIIVDENFINPIEEIKKEIKGELKRLYSHENHSSQLMNNLCDEPEATKDCNSSGLFSIPKIVNQQSCAVPSDFGGTDFAASILPYTERHIRELCRKNIIPYEKPVGKYIFNRQKLEEWALTYGSTKKKEKLRIGRNV